MLTDQSPFSPPGPTALDTVRAAVGESATWSVREQCLYTVDIWGKRLWRHDMHGDAVSVDMPEMAAATVVAEKGVLVALESHLLLGDPLRGDWCRIDPPRELAATHRFNDACVAPDGSLIVGSMRKSQLGAEQSGAIYRLAGGRWTTLARDFWTPNGLAFSPDGTRLYFSDSHPSVQTVWTAAYADGSIGDRRLFADFSTLEGRPDGAAIDAEGFYWSAAVGGGCVHRFQPDGMLDRTILLPVDNPTRPAFGGSGLSTLFITTMAERQTGLDPAGLAGAVLKLPSAVPGPPLPILTAAV